jgi:hypothetical protein
MRKSKAPSGYQLRFKLFAIAMHVADILNDNSLMLEIENSKEKIKFELDLSRATLL